MTVLGHLAILAAGGVLFVAVARRWSLASGLYSVGAWCFAAGDWCRYWRLWLADSAGIWRTARASYRAQLERKR